MSHRIVYLTLAGLAVFAVYAGYFAMLMSVAGIGIALLLTRDAGAGTRATVLLAGALAGGIGGEIGRTIFLQATASSSSGSLYRNAMLLSLLSAAAVVVAFLIESLCLRFRSRR